MQMQSTYWLEKVLKIIYLYVNALLCKLQHIVLHAMQLSGVNSPNWLEKVLKMIYLYVNALLCTLQHIVDATQRCQFGELTPLSCIACMKICCSVHKRALTYKEIIFSTFSNQ